MLNMSIILFRYEQSASRIYNAINMYYFLCKLITDLQNSIYFMTGLLLHKLKLTAVRFKKGTAQRFRLANSARIFINLSWYEHKSYAQKFGSVRFGFGKKFLVRSFPTPDISFKLQIYQFGQEVAKPTLFRSGSCPKPDNIDLDKSLLRTRVLESQKYILVFTLCTFFGKVRRVNFL